MPAARPSPASVAGDVAEVERLLALVPDRPLGELVALPDLAPVRRRIDQPSNTGSSTAHVHGRHSPLMLGQLKSRVAGICDLGAALAVLVESADECHEHARLARDVGAQPPELAFMYSVPSTSRRCAAPIRARLRGRSIAVIPCRSAYSMQSAIHSTSCSIVAGTLVARPDYGPLTVSRLGKPAIASPSRRSVRRPTGRRADAVAAADVDPQERAAEGVEAGREHDHVDVVVLAAGTNACRA